jgi:hypothetical protein
MFSQFSPVEIEGKAELPNSAITFDNPIRSRTMKRMTFAIVTALILGAVTLALPKLKSDVQAKPVAIPATPQIGPDACRRVRFRFTNQRNTRIRFRQVLYFNVSRNRGFNEVVNGECDPGATCATLGDNLPDAQGMRLTRFQLRYQLSTANGWSNDILSPIFIPNDLVCGDDRIYGPLPPQSWEIR